MRGDFTKYNRDDVIFHILPEPLLSPGCHRLIWVTASFQTWGEQGPKCWQFSTMHSAMEWLQRPWQIKKGNSEIQLPRVDENKFLFCNCPRLILFSCKTRKEKDKAQELPCYFIEFCIAGKGGEGMRTWKCLSFFESKWIVALRCFCMYPDLNWRCWEFAPIKSCPNSAIQLNGAQEYSLVAFVSIGLWVFATTWWLLQIIPNVASLLFLTESASAPESAMLRWSGTPGVR